MNDPIYENLRPEIIKEVTDPKIGLKGYLVIDSTLNGQSIGGLRMREQVDQNELMNLAHSMTLKQSFIGIPRGGAKAGIVASETLSDSEKEILLERFGELISDHLKGRKYISGSDMGTNPKLINKVHEGAGIKPTKRSTGSPNSGYFTSLSVLVAIEECIKLKCLDFTKSTFAIQGFGSVGSSLALEIYNRAGKVVAISDKDGGIYNKNGLNIPELIDQKSITDYSDAEKISNDDLLELSVGVLSPCALGNVVNKGNMENIRAKIICAGANEAVTLEADKYLFKKGILYLPDFTTNCGGVLGNAMEFMGLSKEKVLNLFKETLAPKYRKIYEISKKARVTPREIVIKIAEKNFQRMKTNVKKKGIKSNILNIALRSYHKGLIPKFLARSYAYNYFKKLITQDSDLYK